MINDVIYDFNWHYHDKICVKINLVIYLFWYRQKKNIVEFVTICRKQKEIIKETEEF